MHWQMKGCYLWLIPHRAELALLSPLVEVEMCTERRF